MKKLIMFLLILNINSNAFTQKNCEIDSLTLSTPEGFGKTVQGALGSLKYCLESTNYFQGEIKLEGLVPNHDYLMSINGKPGEPGNNYLPNERADGNFKDIRTVHTNSQGMCGARLRFSLTPSDYDLKFFVKDKSDFKEVLYNDYLFLTITNEPSSHFFVLDNCDIDSVTLSTPEGFGKKVTGAWGSLKYCLESSNYFQGEIKLESLVPNHDYLMSINGKPGEPGNNYLPNERADGNFKDIRTVRTNALGICGARLRFRLEPSDYDLKFFVKDKSDYVIVLHHDYLFFTIHKE